MNEKEQTIKIQIEEKTAEWLTANQKTSDETDIPTSAQRALFSRGVYDALSGRVDFALSQVVPEYFHGTDFARRIQNIVREETVKRYPTKTEHHEGWPEIRGKIVENKPVGD
jgi:hypothetical protein